MKILIALCLSIGFAFTALASDIVDIPNTAPAWFATVIALITSTCGLIAHIDAQVSEEFKAQWPWWLRVFWDLLAGNYRHSKNIDSK